MFKYFKELLYTLRRIEACLYEIKMCVGFDDKGDRSLAVKTGLEGILSRNYGGK